MNTPNPEQPKLPIFVRWWLWLHRRHGTPHINRHISVPSWDPTARGILVKCPCGKSGGW